MSVKFLEDVRSFLLDLVEWAVAIVKQWAALITGGVVVGVLYFGQSVFGHFEWASLKWLWLAFFVAAFLAWRKERQATAAANAKAASFSERPELTPRIERLTADTNLQTNEVRSEPFICASISIGNEGFESAATQWELWLRFDTIDVQVAPYSIREFCYVSEASKIDAAGKAAHFADSFDFVSLIGNVTATPIKRGERREGMFLGQLLGVSDVVWSDLKTAEVRCSDFQGRVYTATLDKRPEKGIVKVQDKQFGMPPPVGFRTPPVMPPRGRSV